MTGEHLYFLIIRQMNSEGNKNESEALAQHSFPGRQLEYLQYILFCGG